MHVIHFGVIICKFEEEDAIGRNGEQIHSCELYDKQMSDVAFVTQEFQKEFSFESNVNIIVKFQRFDPEWGEYVDLEPDSDLNHKDKIIAVVTVTPPPQSSIMRS